MVSLSREREGWGEVSGAGSALERLVGNQIEALYACFGLHKVCGCFDDFAPPSKSEGAHHG